MARQTVLSANLKERHVNMMAFTACVGFGLFLQSGIVINMAGPGVAVIAFALACTIMWAIVGCVGEMTALFPIPGPLFEFPGRFLDESVGYATGWLSWFALTVTMAAQIMTISRLFKFNFDPEYLRDVGYPDETLSWNTGGVSPAAWVFIFLIIIFAVNILPVRIYGEVEYFFGTCKMLFISGIIIFNVIVSAAQLVPHSSNFWTWNNPWGFSTDAFVLKVDSELKPTNALTGDVGRLVGLWTGMTTVMFSLLGFETIAMTGPENKDLEKWETIKMSSKKLVMRVSLLYCLACFTGGLNVPYDDPYLIEARWGSIQGGQNSLFVISAVRNRIRGLPQFLNGFFIFSCTSAAISLVYNSSRLLHALASIPEAWPLWAQSWRRRLERTTSQGVPLATVTVSWSIGFLAFLSVQPNSSLALGRMATNATVSVLVVYSVICFSYIRFFHRLKRAAEDPSLENRSAFNREDPQYPYRTSGQLFRAVYGFVFCILLILLNGWQAFLSPFAVEDFIVSYVGPVAFLILILFYHIKSDGWNPANWRWSASMQIQRPPPKVVVSGRRRGKLVFPDQKELFTSDNGKSLLEWIWVWLK
ncbi:proline-specific permease [Eremomyces bilateralis CBS 781.70]|uniref:Proline-specific permease n=1 Tax=Eremomyces bilateralis CBS 781.70 TaxID=1392243 RepID=A0A6G1GH65_9PEZI|nr:proline-specific permease [Eremomyces bilateralis CBS 781.70]KAF1817393.1 proline-specific permease [Eremomyces bilateralis CBS 781.70]